MKKVIFAISIFVISLSSTLGQVENSYKSTLKKMLEVAGTEESFKVAIKQIINMFKQQKTNVPDSIWAEFDKEFSKTSIDDLVEMLSPVYQKYITESI